MSTAAKAAIKDMAAKKAKIFLSMKNPCVDERR
jgi:hypothetical protein